MSTTRRRGLAATTTTIATTLLAWAASAALAPAAATTAFVDFESSPVLPQGPSIYIAVPGPQTIDAGPAVFSGGVVLGLATFFPAIAFASSPNVYGTADFGNHLSRTLSIDINPSFLTTQISFALFNGETFNQSYTVRAFNGAAQVAVQTLANVAPNFNSGYGVIDLGSAGGITRVTVDADGTPPAFDFLIDDIAFNQSLTNVITTPLPPVVQPPAPPVQVTVDTLNVVVLDDQGHRQRRRQRGSALVQVDFGEDSNDIRSEVLLVPQNTPAVPEASGAAMLLAGLLAMGNLARRRARPA